jgi:hypothetical protein
MKGRLIHRLATDRQLDFRLPGQAFAAKAEFAVAGAPHWAVIPAQAGIQYAAASRFYH